MKRYHTAFGCYPKPTEAQFTIVGPQAEDQVPEGVRLLLAMPHITQVDVRYDFGQGLGEQIAVFRNMPEEPTH